MFPILIKQKKKNLGYQDGEKDDMNNKLLYCLTLLISILFFLGCDSSRTYSTTFSQAAAACSIAGAKICNTNNNIEKKYNRKDCPVCKGKGWYISGDKITKVQCGYCEPEKKTETPPKTLIRKR